MFLFDSSRVLSGVAKLLAQLLIVGYQYAAKRSLVASVTVAATVTVTSDSPANKLTHFFYVVAHAGYACSERGPTHEGILVVDCDVTGIARVGIYAT